MIYRKKTMLKSKEGPVADESSSSHESDMTAFNKEDYITKKVFRQEINKMKLQMMDIKELIEQEKDHIILNAAKMT